LILDTSVLFESLKESPLGEKARALMTSEAPLRAPDLIEIEIASAITRAVRRKDIELASAPGVLARARRVMPDVDPSTPLVERAFSFSLELNHPLADCVFLAHAEARGDVLVTTDQRFIGKLSGRAYERHAMYLADWRP
jgi:predicted nucleic acid-binding protein